MKNIKYIPYILLVIILIYGFKTESKRDQFQKMKTFTQIIRLVNENYFEDVNMNDILECFSSLQTTNFKEIILFYPNIF